MPIHDQNCQQTRTRRELFLDKGPMKILVNIVFIAEILKAFLLRLETRQECLFSSFSFHTVLKCLPSVIGKKNKSCRDWKETTSLPILVDVIIIYVKKFKEYTKILLGLINTFNKVIGYKLNM